jgi:CDGSH-type Zn-finger protein
MVDDPPPLFWRTQDRYITNYLICGCKYAKSQPICDGSHGAYYDGYEELAIERQPQLSSLRPKASRNKVEYQLHKREVISPDTVLLNFRRASGKGDMKESDVPLVIPTAHHIIVW